jgi:FKBP-type peptidyl-prolyl cis-trans isomerase FklB
MCRAVGVQRILGSAAYVTLESEKAYLDRLLGPYRTDLELHQLFNEKGITVAPSGLAFKVLRNGTGAAHPAFDAPCECHYEGKLVNGDVFDSSYKRGKPTSFAPKQVISGWTQAMQSMVVGDMWELYVIPELGYGGTGMAPKIGREATIVLRI